MHSTLAWWPKIREVIRRAARRSFVDYYHAGQRVAFCDLTPAEEFSPSGEELAPWLTALDAADLAACDAGWAAQLKTQPSDGENSFCKLGVFSALRRPLVLLRCRPKVAEVELAAAMLGDLPLHRRGVILHADDPASAPATAALKAAAARFEVVVWRPSDAAGLAPADFWSASQHAATAGANVLLLTDPRGRLTPEKTRAVVLAWQDRLPQADDVLLGVECGNRLELAVANSLAAITAGVQWVAVQRAGSGGQSSSQVAAKAWALAMALAEHPEFYERSGPGFERSRCLT